jgi:hypothetical protein
MRGSLLELRALGMLLFNLPQISLPYETEQTLEEYLPEQ